MEGQDSVLVRLLYPAFRRRARYLLEEYRADFHSGHNVRASVFVECQAMYHANGPETMRSVGEVEFANGVAAMAASGTFGATAVCAGIVGGLNPKLGDSVEEVLGHIFVPAEVDITGSDPPEFYTMRMRRFSATERARPM
jgi:hypothetical protein